MSESRRLDPADVPDELVELYRATYMDHSGEEGLLPVRYALAAVLPEFERQVREKVAQDLLAVPMIEWVAARQNAGFDAARIARGES